MEGLPKDIDLSPLIGHEITLVRIGKFLLHYFLDDDFPGKPNIRIEIESSDVTIVDPSGQVTEIDDFRTNGGPLCLLLGLRIEKAHRRDDGGLVLELSEGFKLEVGIDTSMYESIVLHIGDKAFVG
jgi:Family of unknown function (DUF6188)